MFSPRFYPSHSKGGGSTGPVAREKGGRTSQVFPDVLYVDILLEGTANWMWVHG